MNKNYMTLRDDNGKDFQVEVLLTYERDNNTYVVYTDNTKDNDGKERVYAGIYDKDNLILNPIENKEDYNIIESILSSIEKKN